MNEIEKAFTDKNITLLKSFAEAEKRLKHEQKARDEFKSAIEQAMEDYGIKTLDCDFLKVTMVEGSESVSIDTKKIEKEDEELYLTLLDTYPKITSRKSYVRFTVK